MRISLPVESELVSSSVTDPTVAYKNTVKQWFNESSFENPEFMQDDNKLYQWTKETFIPPDYSHSDESNYKVNDIIFKDDGTGTNKVQVVTGLGHTPIPVQPEDYLIPASTGFDFDTWSSFFAELKTGLTGTFDGFTETIGATLHRLYRDVNSRYNWSYEISWKSLTHVWGTEEFDINATDGITYYVRNNTAKNLDIFYGGIAPIKSDPSSAIVENETEFTIGTDKYRVGSLLRRGTPVKGDSKEYTHSGNFIVPEGVMSIHVCMIGGGGGGAGCEDISSYTQAGGGEAGTIQSFDLAVHSGQRIPYNTGAGGGAGSFGNGNAGGNTKFGNTTAAGGAGGVSNSSAHAGNGASTTNCYGTFKDGVKVNAGGSDLWGGQAGFANGGGVGSNGAKGSGGGGAQSTHTSSGAGGKGIIRVSWIDEAGSEIEYYGIMKEVALSKDNVHRVDANVETQVTPNTFLRLAYAVDDAQSSERWVGRTFILRNGSLYMRTRVGTEEYNILNNPTYAVANNLSDLERSGFIYHSPTLPYKPFDHKNYTKIDNLSGTITFEIKAHNVFDTIALGGLIAEEVHLTFNDGVTPHSTIAFTYNNYQPTNFRDVDNRLPDVPSTAVLYSYDRNGAKVTVDRPKGSNVVVRLTGANLAIGTIMLGLSVDAGFTDLSFRNEFVDYSPFERDQWGNVIYVSGVKINVHSGTVKLPIRHYDMIDRLMRSIGGETVIINGSDAMNNQTPDSQCVFDSTMLIGRISNFKLMTQIFEKALSDLATYSFTVKEDV